MIKRLEPHDSRNQAQQRPIPNLLASNEVVDITNVTDALARVYALILSGPTSDGQTSTTTGEDPT